MSISFERAFGIHEKAVALRAYRSGILASNLANADTPRYKARDIDFRTALAAIMPAGPGSKPALPDASRLRVTDPRHIQAGQAGGGATAGIEPGYRTPMQPSIDGNTVDTQVEQAAFMDNALRYQASITLLNGRIRGLMTAIRGE